VIECDICGETLSAANDDELLAALRSHMQERHAGESPGDAGLRDLVEREAYDATDS
jgi:hypothetical protein